MSTRQVGVRLPDHLYDKLEKYSIESKISKSETIISALADYLQSADDIPLPIKFNRLEARVYELENELFKYLSEHKK